MKTSFSSGKVMFRLGASAIRTLIAVIALSIFAPLGIAQTAPILKPPKIEFERLVASTGEVYHNVSVSEVQPDSLIIRHANGVTRVSLFELPDEIRRNYGFDLDKAMAHYKKRDAEQRAHRKKLFYDRIKLEAEQEQMAHQQNFVPGENPDWIHVRAKILSVDGNDALARIERIVMRAAPPRKTALGGVGLPNAPRPTYSSLSAKPVLLSEVKKTGKPVIVGDFWTGYVHRSEKNIHQSDLSPMPPVYKTAVSSR